MSMLANMLFFALLCSGGVLAVSASERRFEEALPLTCFLSVFVLYAFALAGRLLLGAYVVMALAALSYITALVILLRGGGAAFIAAAKRLFTPAFLLYAALFAVSCALCFGMQACQWDELSHWADAPKVLFLYNDLYCDPAYGSLFQSYPPAMALFQYLFLTLKNAVAGEHSFTEWRLYVAFQMFLFALPMPFLKKLTLRNPFKTAAAALAVVALPLALYTSAYNNLTIDPFVGVLAGAGLAGAVLFFKDGGRSGPLDIASLALCAFTLTLSKDVGLLFAVFIVLMTAAGALAAGPGRARAGWLCAALTAAAVLAAKLSWQAALAARRSTAVFSEKIDWGVLWQVITGRDASYRGEVMRSYWPRLAESSAPVGSTGMSVPLYVCFAALLAALYFAALRERSKPKKAALLQLGAAAGLVIVYLAGLCVIFMFKFDEYEALRLSSMQRYLYICLLAVAACALYVAIDRLHSARAGAPAALLALSLLFLPYKTVGGLAAREHIRQAHISRVSYNEYAQAISALIPDGSRIYLISQGSTGFDYWALHYTLREDRFCGNCCWSVGEPFYEGDIWTRRISSDELQKELAEGYDFLLAFRTNGYFDSEYASMFADPSSIHNCGLYKVGPDGSLTEVDTGGVAPIT